MVAAARKATTATFDATKINLVNNGQKVVKVTVKDQYGDLVSGFATGAISVKNANEQEILAATTATTGSDGTVDLTFVADVTNVGVGTMKLMNDTTTIGTLPVKVGAPGTVASRVLEIDTTNSAHSDDYELDLNATKDKIVTVVWNKYNADGLLMGPEKADIYAVASSDTDVATVGAADLTSEQIVVTAVAVGTTTITIKEGTVTRASFVVTVVDSTPVPTSIALAKDVTEIELSEATGSYTFDDIEDNFVVLDQFGETMDLDDTDVKFFTDDAAVLVIDNDIIEPTINVTGITVGKTATLIVKVNGKVVSVAVKVIA